MHVFLKKRLLQEVIKMKIKKITALMMAGVISCTAPVMAMASEQTISQETQADIEDMIVDGVITDMLSDPDKVVEIIMYVKNVVDAQNITEEDISSAIDMAADEYGISLSDSEKSTLVSIAKEMIDMDIDEDELTGYVNKVYSTLEALGIDENDMKSIIKKGIAVMKNILS